MTVYLLLGDDEERKTRGVEKLRNDRAAETYDAAEAGPESVVSACNSYSLFGEGTFVLVRNLDAWNASQKAQIVNYLENPSPEADLVMLGEKLGVREKLLAAVKKTGEIHDFQQPTGKALAKWTIGHAKKQGLELPEDVAALVPPDLQSNIFRFVDALSAGERDRALELLETLLSTNDPPMRILYMIRRQFRLLARSRAHFKSGASRSEVASALKVPPFVAKKLEEQSGKMHEEDLEKALAHVLDLERGLKGGSDLGDELQVELTVLRLSD